MSSTKHDATRPNIDGQTRAHLAKMLKELLNGRDFILLVDEYPRSWVCTNADTPQDAKQMVNKAMAKPWS